MKILRKIYDWTLDKAKHPKAPWFLSLISFTESSFFPIPPDIILIPMIIANRLKAWWYAFICTLSSVAGGLAGYCIGYFFYLTIGEFIIELYSLESQYSDFKLKYDNEPWLWFVFFAGITFFPFKVITIASGALQTNIFNFTIVALISRGLRFYIVATLLRYFGNYIKDYIDRYFNLLSIIFFVLLIGGFIFFKYLWN
jgi:membrane protein YqaA with SNARE-associated domain